MGGDRVAVLGQGLGGHFNPEVLISCCLCLEEKPLLSSTGPRDKANARVV